MFIQADPRQVEVQSRHQIRRKLFTLLTVLLLLVGGAKDALSKSRHSRHRAAKHSSEKDKPEPEKPNIPPGQAQITFKDGTNLLVDDAWSNAQGVWYKRSGVTHLLPADRVAKIERGGEQPAVAKVDPPSQPQKPEQLAMQRTWIFLVGGARMEVDKAEESTAGVWYNRGPLAIFIERSRIDHIEREDLEKSGESASSKEKELRWSSGNGKIDSLIRQNGAKYGVDPYLVFCVMEQESHFGVHATSPKGARGLMQLMPGTSARFGVRHPYSPAENISAGTRYLKQLIAQFNGRVDLVLAGYNAGENAVVKFGHRVPPYSETRAYVKRISYKYKRSKVPQHLTTASGASGNE